MKPFEDELRSLLKPEDPDEGFARRVLERVMTGKASEQTPIPPALSRLRCLPIWAATAAMVCALLGSGAYVGYRAGRIRKGEMAKAEAIQALRIASDKMNAAFQRAIFNGPLREMPRN